MSRNLGKSAKRRHAGTARIARRATRRSGARNDRGARRVQTPRIDPKEPAIRGVRVALAAGVLAGALVPAHALADPLPPGFFGVYSETVYASVQERRSLLDLVARAGATAIREPLDWANAEPEKGELDLTSFDRLVGDAADRGLTVVPVVWNAPDWASTKPAAHAKRGMYPPRDPGEYARFLRDLVRRYGPAGTLWADRGDVVPIRSWEIWNEPNFPFFWPPEPDPAAFARLLEASYRAIHAMDPGAEVIAGGLAPTTTARDYLHALLEQPGGHDFDTLALHPYAATVADVLALLDTARGDLDAAGLGDRGLAAGEFGWATGGQPHPEVTVDEPCQAALTTRALEALAAWRVRLRLRAAVQFMLYDRVPARGARDLWALHTGLLRWDWSPKPSFDAYREASRALAAGGAGPPVSGSCPERTGATAGAGADGGASAAGGSPTAPSAPPDPSSSGPPGYATVTATPDTSASHGHGPFDPLDPSTAVAVEPWLTIRYATRQALARARALRAQAIVQRVPVRVEVTARLRVGRQVWTRGPLAVELRRRHMAGIVVPLPWAARRAMIRALRARRPVRASLAFVGKAAAGPYQRAVTRIRVVAGKR